MNTKITLPQLLEQELKILREEAENNLRELAEERQQLSRDYSAAIASAIRSGLQ